MDLEIPKYRLLENHYKVIGVKEKKQHKYEGTIKEIMKKLNQKEYGFGLKEEVKDKSNN